MTRLLRQALDELLAKVRDGMEYPDAHCFVVTSLGLSDDQAGDLAQAYDNHEAFRPAVQS